VGNPDVASHSLRLNLRNEKHLRVEKALEQINPKIFKSLNEFMIDAIDFYIKYLDGENIAIRADKGLQDNQWATKEELEEMKLVIEKNVKEEVIQLLGMALSGQALQQREALSNETVKEIEEDGITDTAAIDLVVGWG
jgi:hypothetical protein